MGMMKNIKQHGMVILDFGSQYTQLIARRVREMGVYCELHPHDISESVIQALNPYGIILSGGPRSVIEECSPDIPQWVFQRNIPVLGICYGMQSMAKYWGGEVTAGIAPQYGSASITLLEECVLFQDLLEKTSPVWMSHADNVVKLPAGFKTIATSHQSAIAAMAHESQPYFGVQFHPEVTHTPFGQQLLERFVLGVCQAEQLWKTSAILDDLVVSIRKIVGKDKVLLGLSGGVDSSVVALLLHRAIGSQVHAVFVDTGLLRKNESEEVQAVFKKLHLPMVCVEASQRFLPALKGITCPEEKRKKIGQLFIQIFQEEAEKETGIGWLAQGTIYPDVIESASNSAADKIKSHHNVGGLPDSLPFPLLEPLRFLFKDEVKQLAKALCLPVEISQRHPFPGPGLAVRILGEVKPEFVNILRQADAIFIELLREHNLYEKISQAFAVFLPVKSVGVRGDGRCYEYVVSLRAVETTDFMTAHASALSMAFLTTVANRIMNEVPGISRVVYDISGKPPATIEWE